MSGAFLEAPGVVMKDAEVLVGHVLTALKSHPPSTWPPLRVEISERVSVKAEPRRAARRCCTVHYSLPARECDSEDKFRALIRRLHGRVLSIVLTEARSRVVFTIDPLRALKEVRP